MLDPILLIFRHTVDEEGNILKHEPMPTVSLFEIAHLSDVNLSPASLFAKTNEVENQLAFTLYKDEFIEFIQDKTITAGDEELALADIIDAKSMFGSNTSMTLETTVTIAPRGDITLDTSIDSSDAQQVLFIYSRTMAGENIPYHDTNPVLAELAADVDQNGVVDVADAQYILIYYAYLLAEEPNLSWDMIFSE